MLRRPIPPSVPAPGASSAGPSTPRPTTRRAFLLAACGLGGGLVLGACSSGPSRKPATATTPPAPSTTGPGAPATTPPSAALAADAAFAATAASLENLAVYAYRSVLKAFAEGRLGKAPPALAALAATARDHHAAHATAWNGLLAAAGRRSVSGTDPVLTPTVNGMLAAATTALDAAAVALTIENVAAQTYQAGLAELEEPRSLGLAASVQPVEMGHAALLYFLLGRYPGIQGTPADAYAAGAPLAFSPVTLARPASDYPGS